MLQCSGTFIVKVPDFESVLAAYKRGDAAFFADQWGLEQIVPLWRNKRVPDTIETRASMAFCGFWNQAYGHGFSSEAGRQRSSAFDRVRAALFGIELPYHGPAPLPVHRLREILSQSAPREIAMTLRDAVLSEHPNATFNHQTAFSRADFRDWLAAAGLRVVSEDAAHIVETYRGAVPGLAEMRNISAYYLCYRA